MQDKYWIEGEVGKVGKVDKQVTEGKVCHVGVSRDIEGDGKRLSHEYTTSSNTDGQRTIAYTRETKITPWLPTLMFTKRTGSLLRQKVYASMAQASLND